VSAAPPHDPLGYRIIDEPRSGPLQRFALPPLLVFLVGNFFLPWGWLLIAANAIALNGPHRNREIALSMAAIGLYWLGIAALNLLGNSGLIDLQYARYAFVFVLGAGLACAAWAFVSQEQTHQLRKYLAGG